MLVVALIVPTRCSSDSTNSTCTNSSSDSTNSTCTFSVPSFFLFVCVGAAFKGMRLRGVREDMPHTFMLRLTLTILDL